MHGCSGVYPGNAASNQGHRERRVRDIQNAAGGIQYAASGHPGRRVGASSTPRRCIQNARVGAQRRYP